ncbi:MAG: hypothetical protein ACREX4_02390 [Gammaproteobacteria bacterium]
MPPNEIDPLGEYRAMRLAPSRTSGPVAWARSSGEWCILDLDPKGAPFSDVVTIAEAIRQLCAEIALPSYIKTSGSAGLHVLSGMLCPG